MLKKFFPTRNVQKIGLMFSSVGIRYVVFASQDNCITSYGEFPADEIDPCIDSIKKHIVADYQCSMALSQQFVTYKRLSFNDPFKEKEIENFIQINSGNFFGLPWEDILYDYEFLDNKRKSLRIIAARKKDLLRLITVFEKNSLKLTSLTTDVLAVENYLRYSSIDPHKVYGIFITDFDQLIQIIIYQQTLVMMSVVSVNCESTNVLFMEMQKFIKLYEANQENHPKVQEIIVYKDDRHLIDINNSEVFDGQLTVVTKIEIFQKAFPASYLVPMGLILC